MTARYDLADPPQELAIAVVTIMSECAARWIEPVQAIAFRSNPQRAATILDDALDRSSAETIRVSGIMKLADTAFACRIELVQPSIGGYPQKTVIVLH